MSWDNADVSPLNRMSGHDTDQKVFHVTLPQLIEQSYEVIAEDEEEAMEILLAKDGSGEDYATNSMMYIATGKEDVKKYADECQTIEDGGEYCMPHEEYLEWREDNE